MTDDLTSNLDQLSDPSRDPVVTDGDKYKLVLENERVRVLEYRDSPGQRTSPHHHPNYVLCALSAFKRKLTLSGGRTGTGEFQPGQVAWARRNRTSARTSEKPIRTS
jgi:hypothetical protein